MKLCIGTSIAALASALEAVQSTGGSAVPVSMLPGKDAEGTKGKAVLRVGKPLTASELVHVAFGVEETKKEVSLMETFRLSLLATDQQTFSKAIREFPEAAERAGKNKNTAKQYASRFKSMYWAVRLKGADVLKDLGRDRAYAVSREILKAANVGTNGQKLLSSDERKQRAEDKATDAITIRAMRQLRQAGIIKPSAEQIATAQADASEAVAQEWAIEAAADALNRWGIHKAELVAKAIISNIADAQAEEAKKANGTKH